MASIPSADDLDPSALRLFLGVVELGSLSKAAARHGIAQPSATAKLQKLERRLGVQLLDRGPSGSTATDAGVRLAPACADVLAAAEALAERADAVRHEQARLVVASTRHVIDHFVTAWVADSGLDDVVVDVREGDTLSVAQSVRSGDAVIGFVEGPAAPIGLRSTIVATEEIVPVVGRGHDWFASPRRRSARDLSSTRLILGRRGSGTLDVVEKALAGHGFGVIGDRIEVDGSAAARLAAINGAGVALLPRCRVAADVAAGWLRVVVTRGVQIDQPVRVVWRGARPGSQPARRLLDHLGSS